MIIDQLINASRFHVLGEGIAQAFDYLNHTDLQNIATGKYAIDGDRLFAIVQEYDTIDEANEQMETHKKYIDVQYMISGAERVGLALLKDQAISKSYSEEEDFMLYKDAPDFYCTLSVGMFMIFFPTDPHMPCLKVGNTTGKVKKVVVKVAVQ